MNILVITTSFPLTRSSRSGIFVKNLISNFPEDIQTTVITPDSHESSEKRYDKRVVRFRYAPRKYQILAHSPGGILTALTEKKWAFLLLPSFLIAALIASFHHARKADLIYANWSINGVIGGIAGLIAKKSVVTTLRGTDVNKLGTSFIFRILVSLCIKCSTSVVTVSPSLKEKLCVFFPEHGNKVRVIPNGIDDAFFIERHRRPGQDVRLMYAGNLITGKGVHLIVDALEHLREHQWTMSFVGDGPEKETLERLCREKGIEKKVIFRGALPPDSIPAIMQQSDILIFPSFSEGRSNVILEAMASGLGIIASNIPSVSELITDGQEGILFNVGDSDDLSRKLFYLIGNREERERMGRCAQQAISRGAFSWKTAGQRYAELFKEVMQGIN